VRDGQGVCSLCFASCASVASTHRSSSTPPFVTLVADCTTAPLTPTRSTLLWAPPDVCSVWSSLVISTCHTSSTLSSTSSTRCSSRLVRNIPPPPPPPPPNCAPLVACLSHTCVYLSWTSCHAHVRVWLASALEWCCLHCCCAALLRLSFVNLTSSHPPPNVHRHAGGRSADLHEDTA
jgi:hypothetical protein